MESTAKRFPFNTLPMEMKEKILEKVGASDSMKLLEVNKKLRAYILDRGPFYKRFQKIEYRFTRGLLEIIYSLGEERSSIALHMDNDDNVNLTSTRLPDHRSHPFGKNYDLCLSRSTSVHFRFLEKILPPKTIEIHLRYWTIPTLDFLQPAVSLRGLIPSCCFLHGFIFEVDPFEEFEEFDQSKQFGDLIQIFSPRIMDTFECSYNDASVTDSLRDEYLLRLKSMLLDCRAVNIDLEDGGELLFEALRQCNIDKITIDFPVEGLDLFIKHFKLLAANGIPSRNRQAEVIYQIHASLDGWVFGWDDDYTEHFDYLELSELFERIHIEVPSVHRLSSDTEDERKHQELFQEISAANDIDCDFESLRIYETTSLKKCIFFVYHCYSNDYVYLIPRYV